MATNLICITIVRKQTCTTASGLRSGIRLNNQPFDCLIMSLFLYGYEVLGSAYHSKYLERVDTFLQRASSFLAILISDVIKRQ